MRPDRYDVHREETMMKQKKAGRARAWLNVDRAGEKAFVRVGDATPVLQLWKLKLLHHSHGAMWTPTS